MNKVLIEEGLHFYRKLPKSKNKIAYDRLFHKENTKRKEEFYKKITPTTPPHK